MKLYTSRTQPVTPPPSYSGNTKAIQLQPGVSIRIDNYDGGGGGCVGIFICQISVYHTKSPEFPITTTPTVAQMSCSCQRNYIITNN